MKEPILVREIAKGEDETWGALRSRLWPDCGPEDNAEDIRSLNDPAGALRVVFLAFAGKEAIGFAEISERSVVDSAGNTPAAYLEGWYVEPDYRERGVGRRLIGAAIAWARREGYGHLGSDAELENTASQKAHEALGFEATGRVVNYLMALT